jgi:hypothetical protein
MGKTMSKWVERERRKQRWSLGGVAVVMLILMTLDRPGLVMFAIDAAVALAVVLYVRFRNVDISIAPRNR